MDAQNVDEEVEQKDYVSVFVSTGQYSDITFVYIHTKDLVGPS